MRSGFIIAWKFGVSTLRI